MAYIVKAFTPGKLNLAPETLEEEVLQNVAIIVSTPKFSVPLDRGLGLAQRFIDWGDFTFYVSADQIKTFDSLKWDSAAKYSTHDRHLREPLLEFTGTDVETITFTMFFSVFLGVNPIKEIASLLQAMRRGEVNRLVIGPKAYGTNKWVITKLSNSLKRFDRWGNLLVASVNVTMQSYAVR